MNPIELRFNHEKQINFARFKSDGNPDFALDKGEAFLKSIYKSSSAVEFRMVDSKIDALGMEHRTFKQFFRGVEVEGMLMKLHGKNNKIEIMNGDYSTVDLEIIEPIIDQGKALSIALDSINAVKYVWEDSTHEKLFGSIPNNRFRSPHPLGKLVIYGIWKANRYLWELSWKFIIATIEPFDVRVVYVSANDGSLLSNRSILCGSNTPGAAETRYSGTRSIVGDSFLNGSVTNYRLREDRDGVIIQTLNLQRERDPSTAVDFVDNDNNWTLSEHIVFKDQVATDVHWAIENILDYFRTHHNRGSWDNNNYRVISYVHFGFNVPNAFWEPWREVMLFGDGNSQISPLTSLDIVAHEFAHGLDYYEANVQQGELEAPSIAESLSDIWGAIIESQVAPEKEIWVIGEEVKSGGIRSLENPNLLGQPDTYKGTFWLEPSHFISTAHRNNGVMNYWFYILVNGGQITNDFGVCYNISGIGIEKAARILYRGQTTYLTTFANYASTRDAMIQAARDLYGNNSQELNSVINAWFAVGVGDAKKVDGENIICNQGAIQTFTGAPAGYNITWSVNPSYLFTNSTGIGTVAFLQPVSSTAKGFATLTFNTGSCTGSVFKNLWVGPPSSLINGDTSPYPGQLHTYTNDNLYDGGGPPYLWIVDGGIIHGGGGLSDNTVTVFWNHDGFIQLSTENICGVHLNTISINPST